MLTVECDQLPLRPCKGAPPPMASMAALMKLSARINKDENKDPSAKARNAHKPRDSKRRSHKAIGAASGGLLGAFAGFKPVQPAKRNKPDHPLPKGPRSRRREDTEGVATAGAAGSHDGGTGGRMQRSRGASKPRQRKTLSDLLQNVRGGGFGRGRKGRRREEEESDGEGCGKGILDTSIAFDCADYVESDGDDLGGAEGPSSADEGTGDGASDGESGEAAAARDRGDSVGRLQPSSTLAASKGVRCSATIERTHRSSGTLLNRKELKEATVVVSRGKIAVFAGFSAPSGAPEFKASLAGRLVLHTTRIDRGKLTLRLVDSCTSILLHKGDPVDLSAFGEAVTAGKNAGSTTKRCRGTSHNKPATKVLRRELPSHFTPEQRDVLSAAWRGESLFFTGSAGTGKSLVLRELVSTLPKETTAVVASTGIAACAVGGTTLHSFVGGGSLERSISEVVATVRRSKESMSRWLRTRTLVCDEISMIDAATLDLVEQVARRVRGKQEPFGGIQLIISGDFFQLPPVSKSGEKLKAMAFEAKCWEECVPICIQLEQVFRQADSRFVSILDAVRWGICDRVSMEALRERVGAPLEDLPEGILPTKLYSHKADVDRVNLQCLGDLDGELVTYEAVDTIGAANPLTARRQLESSCRARRTLQLKVGAQVILVRTLSPEEGLVNGSRGVVTRFLGVGRAPVVRFGTGKEVAIRRNSWTVKSGDRVVATRVQMPLDLAWALSTHKSQGLSLDAVEIDLRGVFECGQAYVALSRARSLSGLRLLSDFDASVVRAHPKVIDFYEKLRVESESRKRRLGLAAATTAGAYAQVGSDADSDTEI